MAAEYTVASVKWVVADSPGLLAFFGIGEGALGEWHACMMEKPVMFEVCRRRWGVRELTDMDPLHMMPWEDRLIAERMKLGDVSAVGDLLARGKSWWARHAKASAKASKKKAGEEMLNFSGDARPFTKEEQQPTTPNARVIKAQAPKSETASTGTAESPLNRSSERPAENSPEDERLERFGFGSEKDPKIRQYILRAIDEHAELLESASDRVTLVKMLQDEVTLRFVTQERISKLRTQIRAMLQSERGSVDELTDKKLKEQMAAADGLQKAIDTAKEQLGLGEGESGAVAIGRGVRNNVSYLIEAHREFYALGDRDRVDGVWTVAELRILMRVYGDRPAQYRGDLPLIAKQVADRLWDESCDPAVPTRDQQRKLRRAVRQICESWTMEEFGGIEDLSDDDEDADLAAAMAVPAPPAGAAGAQDGQDGNHFMQQPFHQRPPREARVF